MNEAMAGETPDRRRRGWLTMGIAAAAAAAGGGFAWWRIRPADTDAAQVERLWTLSFEQPHGGTLAMADFRGRPLLVNFWATWCPPCVEEMPLLDAFFREKSVNGWQVLGLAVDQPGAVRTFLQRRPVTFPIAMAGLEGTELSRELGNLSGGLPYSVLFAPDGAVLQRKMGKLSEAELKAWGGIG